MNSTTKTIAASTQDRRFDNVPQLKKSACNDTDPDFPVFPEYYDPEFPSPRIAPLPGETAYQAFFQRSLSQKLKAPQSLRDRIMRSIENSEHND